MAKFYNNRVKTGRLAGSVFAIRFGETIERAYQPVVANPQTAKQVAARAKLKLLSQLSAAFDPIIAMRRKGSVSGRNQFIKANYSYTEFNGQEAVIPLGDVLLTNSVSGLAGLAVSRTSGTGISVNLDTNVTASWDKVMYVAVVKTASQEVMPFASVLVEEAGENGTFPAQLPYTSEAVAVYAYGIRPITNAARLAFEELQAPTAQDYARVLTTSSLTDADVVVSETRGLYMEVGETSATTTGVRSVVISARPTNTQGVPNPEAGSVTGAGSYAVGANVSLEALALEGYRFVSWYNTTDSITMGTENPLTFAAQKALSIAALFAQL